MSLKKYLAALFLAVSCSLPNLANAMVIYEPNPSMTIQHDDIYATSIRFYEVYSTSQTMNIGDSGTFNFINNAQNAGGLTTVSFWGYLPPNSMITYSLSSPDYSPIYGGITATSETRYPDGDFYYLEAPYSTERNHLLNGYSNDNHRTDLLIDKDGHIKGKIDLENPLTFAAAQFVGESPSEATAYIKNISSGAAFARVTYFRYYPEILGEALTMQVKYEVSAVPLPASLPLFALGLTSFAGIRSRRKFALS